MEVMRSLMKQPQQTESLAIGIFAIAVLYTVVSNSAHTALLGVGFVLVVLGALPRQVALAFLVGASAILLVQTKGTSEGFADAPGSGPEPKPADTKEKPVVPENTDKVPDKKGPDPIDRITLGVEASEGFSKNKPMLPDNTDRKEPLELGKPYKLPNEQDDKGFHLDAGTTFLNAYKALKPDQIAAMTKDTQDLLATQKSLIGMLDSFGPLMKDMNKITGFFGTKE
jgi:hypothetical protein